MTSFSQKPYLIKTGGHRMEPCPVPDGWETLTVRESRGYIWLFEEPLPHGTYVIGCDPAQGVPDWDRTAQTEGDADPDNAAISVWRTTVQTVKDEKGKERQVQVDYQVAEYAAPVDYVQTARVMNALGRLYAGNSPMGCAHAIIEVYPGPGWMVEKELIHKYGYMNMYQPKYINTMLPTTTKGIGWQANKNTVRDLWILGRRHMEAGTVVTRSPWLVSEMATTQPLTFLSHTSEAESGFHDDRIRAAFLGLWVMHDFNSPIKPKMESEVKVSRKGASWQNTAVSREKMMEEWEEVWEQLGGDDIID